MNTEVNLHISISIELQPQPGTIYTFLNIQNSRDLA